MKSMQYSFSRYLVTFLIWYILAQLRHRSSSCGYRRKKVPSNATPAESLRPDLGRGRPNWSLTDNISHGILECLACHRTAWLATKFLGSWLENRDVNNRDSLPKFHPGKERHWCPPDQSTCMMHLPVSLYPELLSLSKWLISRPFDAVQIAERIRPSVDSFTEAFPAVLEIPSKDHPYDPEKDSVLRRVRRLFGEWGKKVSPFTACMKWSFRL